MSSKRLFVAVPALAAALSCGSAAPTLDSVAVSSGETLTGVVTYASHGAACARLRWTSDSDTPGATACVPGSAGKLVALGLKPATSYNLVVELYDGRGGVTRSPAVTYASPDLPQDLKDLRITVSGRASAGLTLTGVYLKNKDSYVIAFDSSGVIRWYQALADSAWLDAQQLPNGDFTVFSGTSHGWDPAQGSFLQLHPTGELVASYSVALPEYLDPHELRMTWDAAGGPTLHYFTYVIEPYDLTSVGGTATSPLAIHSIVRQRIGSEREVVWDAHGQVDLSDRIEGPSPLTFADLVHPNSLDFDGDGNYVVSFRDLGEVRKIDARTGATLWRLGGVNSDFTFVNDPLGGFSAQHCARMLANGNLLVYDNGWRHSPSQTRAVEYALDLEQKTATLVWEYRHGPAVFTQYMGSVQRLARGSTQVGFSQAGLVDEVDARGNLLWEAQLTNPQGTVPFYRALRIAALDQYRAP